MACWALGTSDFLRKQQEEASWLPHREGLCLRHRLPLTPQESEGGLWAFILTVVPPRPTPPARYRGSTGEAKARAVPNAGTCAGHTVLTHRGDSLHSEREALTELYYSTVSGRENPL